MKRLFSLLLAAVLAAALAVPCLADSGGPLKSLVSGTVEEEYYIPSSGAPVSGCSQAVFDGTNFFLVLTTADRRIVGCRYSLEGTLLGTVQIADLGGTEGDLSQPSVCVLDGTVYVGWAAVTDGSEGVGGGQYICTVSPDGTVSGTVCVCDQGVWPRRPAMAAGDDGVLLVYRVFERVFWDEWDEEGYYTHNCYAVYLDRDLTHGEPYRINDEEFAIYPAAAYAPETGQFLVAWQHGSVVGALVTKDTAATPENMTLLSSYNGAMERPWVASDGSRFLVSADNKYNDGETSGIWTVLVDAEGQPGAQRRAVPLQYVSSLNNGQLAWDGSGWLASYSCEMEWHGNEMASVRPDFRLTDSYVCRLDPEGAGITGPAAGVATDWWHQTHPRLALGGGRIFCSYVDNQGGSTRLGWRLIRGDWSAFSDAPAADSGLLMTHAEEDAFGALAGGDSDGLTAWALGDSVSRFEDGLWQTGWAAVDSKTFAFSAADGVIYAAGWAGSLLRGAEGSEGPSLEYVVEPGSPIGSSGTGVWAQRGDTVWITGADGTVWRWQEGGAPQCSYGGGAGLGLHDIHGSSGSDIYAVGDCGLILHYDGSAWQRIESPVCLALNAVFADGAGGAWIGGDGGVVLRVSGGVCRSVPSPVRCALYDIWGEGPDSFFVCGADVCVLHYENGAWTRLALDRRYLDYWSDSMVEMTPNAAVTHIFAAEEDGGLRLFAICESDDLGLYSVLLPMADVPLLRARLIRGAVRYTLGPEAPADAIVFAARYDDAGRMTAIARGEDGAAAPEGDGSDIRVFLLDAQYRPLCPPVVLTD